MNELLTALKEKVLKKAVRRREKVSARGEKLIVLCRKIGQCQQNDLLALVSEITGEVLPIYVGPGPGDMVVPLTNANSHDYVIGAPVLHIRNGTCVNVWGRPGNQLGISSIDPSFKEGTHWRYATPEETDQYFALADAMLAFSKEDRRFKEVSDLMDKTA